MPSGRRLMEICPQTLKLLRTEIRTGIRSKLEERLKRIIQNESIDETAGMSHPAVMMSGSWGVLGAIFTVIGSKNMSSLFTRMV